MKEGPPEPDAPRPKETAPGGALRPLKDLASTHPVIETVHEGYSPTLAERLTLPRPELSEIEGFHDCTLSPI